MPWFGCWVFFLLLGCDRQPAIQTAGLPVFGTLVEITLVGADEASGRAALDTLDARFRQMHRDWHPWAPGKLTRLNDALSSGTWSPVDPELLALIEASVAPAQASDHRFNPTIGRLAALWGFHNNELPVGEAPDPEAIASLVGADPRITDLEFGDGMVRSRNSAVQLDFSGIAKGYALDLARQQLRGGGMSGALLNAGGDLCVLGRGTNGPWRIGIRDPFDHQAVLMVLALSGELCAMTSGNYERYRQGQGVRWGHLLDPRTGYPVEAVASVTVIHPNGARADASATALAVAGWQWREVAAAMGLEQVMVVTGDGAIAMTPAFRALLVER